jgi:PqqD family protein of HPr-rel-A system
MARWVTSTNLTWIRYDDSPQWVVHSAEAGTMHLLNEEAKELWDLIAATPGRNDTDLRNLLAARLGQRADPELTAATEQTLATMDAAGLISPSLE